VKPDAMDIRFQFSTWHIAFAMECNLRCSYCSTKSGTKGTDGGTMSRAVWAKSIDRILACAPANETINVEFGVGETFLKFNEFLTAADALQAEAGRKRIKTNIRVCTNGTLLNEEKILLLVDRGVTLTFSIDGPQSIHDICRRNSNGKGSFSAAFRNWKLYREISAKSPLEPACSVQSVYTDYSSLPKLVDFWSQQKQDLFTCIIQLPGSYNQAKDVEKWKNRQRRYLEELEAYAMGMAGQLSVPDFLSKFKGPQDLYLMWRRLLLEREFSHCGAGENTAAIDIHGTIYPCEFFIGSNNWIIGNVSMGLNNDVLTSFCQSKKGDL